MSHNVARRSTPKPLTILLLAGVCASMPKLCSNRAFALGPGRGAPRLLSPLASGYRRPQSEAVSLRAEPEAPKESLAMMKLETDIEAKMKEASDAKDEKRVVELARLMVLAKSSFGASVLQPTAELRETVANNIAITLREFVGKEDYSMDDVIGAVDVQVSGSVSKLNGVYISREAAKSAPPGTKVIILTEVMGPVVGEIKEGAKEAVAGFTGKEKYVFGDISKEVDKRAKQALANALGKEEYQFGDLSKAAASKAMDAVTSFTGKSDYQFGDVTKSLLKGALNFMEGGK